MVSEALGTCSCCARQSQVSIYRSINVASEPELKEKVSDGSLFTWECPHCGTTNLMRYETLYHDPDHKMMILLADAGAPLGGSIKDMFAHDETLKAYTARLVTSPGDLIEKIKIFDAGLDDIVVELCKYVTRLEMGKEITGMKFLRLDGADNDIILTYPSKGQMEMLSVGFNVYEDCRGILQRNPAVSESVKGFATVDQDWVASFMG